MRGKVQPILLTDECVKVERKDLNTKGTKERFEKRKRFNRRERGETQRKKGFNHGGHGERKRGIWGLEEMKR